MTIWPPQPDHLRRPAYRSLAETIVRAVEAGELQAGERLPTHRNLAYDLNLSVQTVSRAYDELIRRGVIVGEVGRGTFVRTERDDPKPPYLPDNRDGTLIDLSILKPVFKQEHLEAMRSILAEVSVDLPETAISSFRPARALQKYEAASRKWLKLCGLGSSPQGLLLTNGNSSAMTVALMTATSPGDLIVTENLGLHTLKPLSRYLGLRVQGLETDDLGIVPDAFSSACERGAVKVIYLMPTGMSPRAFTMDRARREEIVRVARRHDVLIVENDAWGPVQPDRPAPIAALAPERCFYFTSLTKCIMPGLRFGFLVMPEIYEAAAANRSLVTNWMATPLMADIGARWIENGTAERFLHDQTRHFQERNRIVREMFSGLDFRASRGGLHVWLPMPGSWTEETFVALARQQRVAVASGSSFLMSDTSFEAGVRICLGGEPEDRLRFGLNVLARLARSQPEPAVLTL
jgi:DNA-binding transcriptional MocR family regulator